MHGLPEAQRRNSLPPLKYEDFFSNMLYYMDQLDSTPTHGKEYRKIIVKAWKYAQEAYDVGVPKAWFYLKHLEGHASNDGIKLKFKRTTQKKKQRSFNFK